MLDWYTVLVGVFALVTLAAHGATYLHWKTSGAVQQRSHLAGAAALASGHCALHADDAATAYVQPVLYPALIARPWTWLLAIGIVVSPCALALARQKQELPAFLASAGFILCLLAATAAGLYPVLLSSSLDHAYDMTTANAATGEVGLRIGLIWWIPAMLLAIGYFTYLFVRFEAK